MFTENGISALANAMQSVGEAIDQKNDQQCVEQVLSLEWGALDEKDSRVTFIQPTKWEGEQEHSWRYSYDGVPEWCESDFEDRDDGNVTYLTLIEVDVSYESYAPEWLLLPDGKLYVKIKTLGPSAERECPAGYDHSDGSEGHLVGTADTAGMHKCPLCEEPKGEEHGYIYIGESFEHVYKHVEFECTECGLTRADMMPDQPLCDCCYCSPELPGLPCEFCE